MILRLIDRQPHVCDPQAGDGEGQLFSSRGRLRSQQFPDVGNSGAGVLLLTRRAPGPARPRAEAIALAVQQADDLAVFLIRENSTGRASGRFVLVLVRSGPMAIAFARWFWG
jgi:hypothetical protein